MVRKLINKNELFLAILIFIVMLWLAISVVHYTHLLNFLIGGADVYFCFALFLFY